MGLDLEDSWGLDVGPRPSSSEIPNGESGQDNEVAGKLDFWRRDRKGRRKAYEKAQVIIEPGTPRAPERVPLSPRLQETLSNCHQK
ncbi:hypothetical protein EYF80_034550 [Liparis tanakae]|uniref:Uncharacterized protein n=1 Tax=Liparis tanakae TaxID=230148 RepID=A0A4Z2GNR5_9TELE|nr:hypothetical protein EYF80_034550 [Liparis tanakae]